VIDWTLERLADRPTPVAVQPARRWIRADTGVALLYLALALLVFGGQWLDLRHGYLYYSAQDQNMWEWFFTVTARAVTHLGNPLFSDLQNHPLGVNLMANTAMLGLGIPLAPITLTFGPTVTWAIALTGGMAGTALAWYWVLSRHLVRSRAAAAVGGGFCALAPPIVSHANAHPNFVVLFLLPFIVLRIVRLARGERPVRGGVILGLLVAYQILLGEEPLLIFAVTLLVFGLAYAASRPHEVWAFARPALPGLGIGVLVTLAVAAFPLWWQFAGPQSYQSLEHGPVGNDLAALGRFPSQSVAGDPELAQDVAMNRTEENGFFGWPLLALVAVMAIWLWRDVLARSAAIAVLVLAWLSLGVELVIDHVRTGIPGPWALLADLPLFDSVLESRFALGCVPAIGVLLALASERAFAVGARPGPGVTRLVWTVALVAALGPIVPTPLQVEQRRPTPQFFADGTWRQYVRPGGVVVPAPLPNPGNNDAMHWQAGAGLAFAVPEGYFVGPGATDRKGRYGAVQRPTSALLEKVADRGIVPPLGERDRVEALADLRFWRADIVVVPPQPREEAVRATVELLLRRPAFYVDGVWLWDVRALTH
jgi:hypothetical protein